MSQSVYGSCNLHVTDITSDLAPVTITEQEVVADPTTPNVKNTVLMGTGFKRNKYNMTGIINSTDLATMLAYAKAKSSNTFTVYVQNVALINESCIIEKLSWNTKQGQNIITVTINLIQA